MDPISNEEFKALIDYKRKHPGELDTTKTITDIKHDFLVKSRKRLMRKCNPLRWFKWSWRYLKRVRRQRRIKLLRIAITNYFHKHRDYQGISDNETKELIRILGLCGPCNQYSNKTADSVLMGSPTVPFYLKEDYPRKKNGKFLINKSKLKQSEVDSKSHN